MPAASPIGVSTLGVITRRRGAYGLKIGQDHIVHGSRAHGLR